MKTIWQKDYAMVFWANEDRDPIETVLKMNDFLSRYGEEYQLKYLNEKIEVAMDRQTIAQRIAPRRNMGRSITQSYFSRNRIWFDISTGVVKQFAGSHTTLPEVLKFEFDLAHLQEPNPAMSFGRLKELFQYCLYLFEPYYGWLEKGGEINDAASPYREIFKSIDLSKIPAAIQWFNYFGPEMVERLGGLDKVLAAPVYSAEPVPELGGAILILQEELFDFTNPDHLQRRQIVEDYLDLKRLHQLYAKQ